MWTPTEWVVGKESVTGLTQFLYPDVTWSHGWSHGQPEMGIHLSSRCNAAVITIGTIGTWSACQETHRIFYIKQQGSVSDDVTDVKAVMDWGWMLGFPLIRALHSGNSDTRAWPLLSVFLLLVPHHRVFLVLLATMVSPASPDQPVLPALLDLPALVE